MLNESSYENAERVPWNTSFTTFSRFGNDVVDYGRANVSERICCVNGSHAYGMLLLLSRRYYPSKVFSERF